jgi:hypothetical protein
MAGDDDDWVGTPPEGRYTRDRAKPEFWGNQWQARAAGGAALLILIVIVLILVLTGPAPAPAPASARGAPCPRSRRG